MARPYRCSPEVATVLAQIACHDNQLPQGAPTSPVLANMVCWGMDSALQRLAGQCRSTYTRYADDLTFSTNRRDFPTELATIDDGEVRLGPELAAVLERSGFRVNARKVRLQTREFRQEVTGLTVNVFPNVRRRYVRQIRAMLHAWRTFGLAAAEAEYRRRYAQDHRGPGRGRSLLSGRGGGKAGLPRDGARRSGPRVSDVPRTVRRSRGSVVILNGRGRDPSPDSRRPRPARS